MSLNIPLKIRIIEQYHSQINFSKVVNMHYTKVSMIVNGHRELSDDQKKTWAKALDCSVDELFKAITARA